MNAAAGYKAFFSFLSTLIQNNDNSQSSLVACRSIFLPLEFKLRILRLSWYICVDQSGNFFVSFDHCFKDIPDCMKRLLINMFSVQLSVWFNKDTYVMAENESTCVWHDLC